jgi:alcohol dehydrogenase
MRAVVYHGPGQKAWEEVPDPEIIGDDDVTDPATFDVIVKDGVVTLAGKPGEVGHELVHRVRHVHGVVAVRDRLSYPLGVRVTAGPGLTAR